MRRRLAAYILVGPSTLNEADIQQALSALERHREAAIEQTIPSVLSDEWISLQAIAEKSGTDIWDLVEDALQHRGLEQLVHIVREREASSKELRADLRGFASWWNRAPGDEVDTVAKPDPFHTERKIVVAGGMSGSEPPTSAGYWMLDWANKAGVLKAFGIR